MDSWLTERPSLPSGLSINSWKMSTKLNVVDAAMVNYFLSPFNCVSGASE